MILSNQKIREFIRFCIVGVIATAIHYGIYLALIYGSKIENELWINVAYAFGYGCGFVCNLWLSANYTFKERLTWKRSGGFFITNAINFGLHIGLLNLFLYFGIPEQWAPLLVYCIAVPVNFILVRFVFKNLK